MPVTMEQARLNTQDDIQAGIIDEFRKSSFILNNITFDDAVTPGTSGATLTYGYTRVIEEAQAAFRAINSEYTNHEAKKQRYTTELKVFGGQYKIDRVLARTGGLADEVAFQTEQKVKATRTLFHDTVINGDSGANEDSFDGLDKAITGTSTEHYTEEYIDISSTGQIESNYKKFLFELDEFLSRLDEKPDVLASNTKMYNRLVAIAREAGYLTSSEDAFGRKIWAYNDIPIVDLGAKPGSNNPVVAIDSRTVGGSAVSGLTDLYAWRFGLDAFHGVSLANTDLVKIWLPDFDTAGAVKPGEVEMVSSVALKRTKSAGVFRNIKVV
ncbi:hypothetical protein J2S74_002304 [Evansella vedderi]|uniref:Phage capsid protein n=1 Tax=Evansella vedderi TaxID=38282 RepID=A0ABT9ZW00_9BACI|nr:phage capsid protein [Evansella vedderi]MDQ0254922.1 hypothetical protein [Evansella vedderi]